MLIVHEISATVPWHEVRSMGVPIGASDGTTR
jgi:hypothetical protein